ncbi:MAG: hypothetical protein KF871_00435 [Hydrogenophaga sp.]|uniref:hypothetical protein n=1 Tax=Hydrogenophaga sp. TaxID=1904254 RepID=UPI001D302352|nr:hypothetical protein [Hydrogenophaga sp.]MBX3608332.1 hypothetical protein [Hydrogenophaga sp.]
MPTPSPSPSPSPSKRPAPLRRAARALWLMVMTACGAGTALAEQIVGARYAEPTPRYGHFALGPPHEYASLVARTNTGRELSLTLPPEAVFEDLAPRLVQLSAGTATVLLTIVSTQGKGSSLAVIGLNDTGTPDARPVELKLLAASAPIGTPNRWLNPVGVADLDGDGQAEIAAVTTPHIGGVLRVYRRNGAQLVEIASLPGFSNHVYGSPELGLSGVARIGERNVLLVPDARRASVRAMALRDGQLIETGSCPLPTPISGPDALRWCEDRLGAGEKK